MKVKGAIPSVFTGLNLFCGYKSITLLLNGDFVGASWCIFFSILFDMADGKIARKLGTASDFGLQLDSICDTVSFGIAPTMLLYKVAFQTSRFVVSFVPFIYLLAVVFRLARFNVISSETPKDYYLGLSSPSSAAVVISTVLVQQNEGIVLSTEFYVILVLVLAMLMTSRIKYPTYKWQKTPESLQTITLIVALILVGWLKYYALLSISYIYALTGIVNSISEEYRKRRRR